MLRDTTERPEAVEVVKLIGTEKERIYSETQSLLADAEEYRRMATACNPYGDGQAAKRIVQTILWRHGLAANAAYVWSRRKKLQIAFDGCEKCLKHFSQLYWLFLILIFLK